MAQNPGTVLQQGRRLGWRVGLLALAAAALIAAVAAGGHGSDDPGLDQAAAPPVISCKFPNAYRATYRLTCSSHASGAITQTMAVEGSLLWESTPAAAGTNLVRVALKPDAHTAQTVGPAEVIIEQRSDCSIGRIALSGAWPAASSALLAQVLGNLQLTLPGTTGVGQWQARQADEVGDYIAEYAGSTLVIRKQKLRYLRMAAGGALPRITHSQLDVALDPEGRWAVSAVLKQALQHPSPFPALARDINAALDIRLERQSIESLDDVQVVSGLPVGYHWSLEPFRMPDPPAGAAAPASAANIDQVLRALREMRDKGGADREQIKFLVAWLRGRPGGAQALYAVLRAGGLSESEAAMAWLALRIADNKESVAVLRNACEDRVLAGKEKVRALWALSDATVAPESAEVLLRVAHDQAGDPEVAHAALRASGHFAKRLAPADAAARQKIQELITGALDLAASDDDRLAGLDGVFNAEDQAFGAAITDELLNSTPAVRAHAIEALAAVLDERAEAAALVAAADLSVQVRHSAAKALQLLGLHGHLSSSTIVGISERLAAEGDVAVRLGLVAALGAAAATQPSAKQQLAAHYKREQDVQVLVHIGRYCTANDLK